jgi:signal transduction histidine kinase
MEFRSEPIDLATLARDVIDRFAAADDAERIRLVGTEPAWVEGDASRLDQVVTNLLDNAVKYSDHDAPVELELGDADGGVTLVVRDRGFGLDEEASARLFEAFGRGLNAEHIPGLGLGLFISHQIVERHGGRIAARARPDGRGSEFTLWLPAGRPA